MALTKGVADGGRTPAMIDLNSKKKKPYADDSICADHYHRYKEDVALMAECGFSSYRFSISWSRIIPHSDGKVNPEGIAFYNDLINELVKNGITPIITLYHYDLPVWVFEELGGWKSRKTIDAFDHYVRTCFENFGDRVKYWLSINEQNMQIVYGHWLGTDAGCTDWEKEQWDINHIMNLCHAKAVIACHEMVEGGKIGPVPGYVPIYPKTCNPADQIAAMNAEELTEKIWNDTYVYGEYSNFVKRYWKEKDIHPDIRPEEFALCANPYVEYTDWDWEIDPVGMEYMLQDLYNRYNKPLMITENGFGAFDTLTADKKVHDDYRIHFLRENIRAVKRAIDKGVEVIAYCPWSAVDLLSTSNGVEKRYGLIYVDRTDDDPKQCERIRKDSFYWYKKVIASNGADLD